MTKHALDTPQFYLTAPAPCPYLKGKEERKVFTHLVGERAKQINDMLSQGGFRRSQNIAYRPACEGCKACVSVRVLVDEFKPGKSFKRIMRDNADLKGVQLPPAPTSEQFSLFRRYLDDRHSTGGMAEMTSLDYAMMVEDTHVNTMLIEYRRRSKGANGLAQDGELVAAALTDVLANGLSMVYSFFDTDPENKSLGTFMILDHIRIARKLGLPYVYMGYWVDGSQKMDYKTRFRPQEHLTMSGWERWE
ncbi:MAG: arginyltransferase [Pseudomonadota bacterium]